MKQLLNLKILSQNKIMMLQINDSTDDEISNEDQKEDSNLENVDEEKDDE